MRGPFLLRMIAPVGIISFLLALLGGTAAWYVHRLQKATSDVLALNVASVRAAEELEIGLLEVRGLLKDYVHTGNHDHLIAVTAFRRQTDKALHDAERLATTFHEQALISDIQKGYARFFREFDAIAQQDGMNDPPVAQLRTLTDTVLAKEILQPAREYLSYNEQMAARNSEQNQAMSHRIALALVLLAACGAVAGLLAGYAIARAIARSVGKLRVPIQDTATRLDSVTGPVTLTSGEEFQDLETDLRMVARQAGVVVKRLQESQRDVLRAEQLAVVGQMAAGLAHELRNPLMSMKVLLQPIADQGPLVNLTERDVEVLNEEITRLERLIQSFLDFARPPQPEKRPFDVNGVIDQTVILVSGRAEQQGIRIERIMSKEPVVIEADMSQVRQVLLNLLLNALDATSEGGIVTISARSNLIGPTSGGQACDEWLEIRIADTGCGLPMDLGLRIFDPFVSKKETGLGLGLSICNRIVEAHGGAIAAANQPRGGAVFTVRLPLHMSRPDQPRPNQLECHATAT